LDLAEHLFPGGASIEAPHQHQIVAGFAMADVGDEGLVGRMLKISLASLD